MDERTAPQIAEADQEAAQARTDAEVHAAYFTTLMDKGMERAEALEMLKQRVENEYWEDEDD